MFKGIIGADSLENVVTGWAEGESVDYVAERWNRGN